MLQEHTAGVNGIGAHSHLCVKQTMRPTVWKDPRDARDLIFAIHFPWIKIEPVQVAACTNS